MKSYITNRYFLLLKFGGREKKYFSPVGLYIDVTVKFSLSMVSIKIPLFVVLTVVRGYDHVGSGKYSAAMFPVWCFNDYPKKVKKRNIKGT